MTITLTPNPLFLTLLYLLGTDLPFFSPRQGSYHTWSTYRIYTSPVATWSARGPIRASELTCTIWPWPMGSCGCLRMGGTTCIHRWALFFRLLTTRLYAELLHSCSQQTQLAGSDLRSGTLRDSIRRANWNSFCRLWALCTANEIRKFRIWCFVGNLLPN